MTIRHLEEALRLRPNLALAHFELAHVHLRNNKLEEARAELLSAIALDPSMGLAHARLGQISSLRKDWATSIRVLKRGVRTNSLPTASPNLNGRLLHDPSPENQCALRPFTSSFMPGSSSSGA